MTTQIKEEFQFPKTYSFPPFFTPQPNSNTRHSQLQKWSSLIQSYCRHYKLYRLNLIDAIETPLFHNAALKKRVSLPEAREILEFMVGDGRAEWVDSGKGVVWIWWRRPEEWAGLLVDWVESTGQKNVVLTVYELVDGEDSVSQEWHGMDTDVMMKSLNVLVKRGKAQVFGNEGQEGVKFF
ncbi:ESCRT-II complex, vps25 subunit [Aspergillus avenaceus]|uniref:Vacuolar protein-sorting-associated protein 25 n=1 Tax=Aspergillus avenaceus TaxID=36643 RepID=A0A5N6U0P7_ASPAV|nr:ESCRT-II complex, vps25 subunit [Aspergillus avenaceus]